MRRYSLPLLLLLLLFPLGGGAVVRGQESIPSIDEERAIFGAFSRGEHARAVELIEQFLRHSPDSPAMLYNAACGCSLLGRRDDAVAYLLRAIEAGFTDFDLLRSDPDLEAIRDHETYTAIVEAVRRVSSTRAEAAQERWRAAYGDRAYRYERDETRHLTYATALDEVSHKEMRRMLERQADQAIASLFGEPPAYDVLIAVPTPEHARQLLSGGQAGVSGDQIGGIYEHGRRRLVARETGVSLRHEFIHALHYGHMERLGQQHPLWIQEGLASLYEDYELEEDGAIRFLPNRRDNIMKQRIRSGLAMKWRDLFALPTTRFMSQAGALYPQVRSMFEFLAAEQKLERWYRVYIDQFDGDPTGAKAFELVFDQPIEDVERAWRTWVRSRPLVDMEIDYGDASLGIETELRGSNDGVLITRVIPGSAASRARLRRGDVIVAVEDRPTRSFDELRSVLAGKAVGDRVRVRFRRGGDYDTTIVTLTPLAAAGVFRP